MITLRFGGAGGRIRGFSIRVSNEEHKLLKARALRLGQSMGSLVWARGVKGECAAERRYQARQRQQRIKRPPASGTSGRLMVARAG